MRTNRPAVIWSAIITAIAFIGALVLHYSGEDFWSNILAGIFASGVLTIMISVINYCTERRKTLERFYSYAKKAAYNYNQFEDDGNLERSIDSVLEMNKFDYLELDNAFGDMCFLFNGKKTRKYIYDKIYKPTLDLRSMLEEKCFHFKEYRKSANGNSAVMKIFVNEVAEVFIETKEVKMTGEQDSVFVITTKKNKIVDQLLEELDGHYFEIMYPHTKKGVKNAD